jgi:hypothetical protein
LQKICRGVAVHKAFGEKWNNLSESTNGNALFRKFRLQQGFLRSHLNKRGSPPKTYETTKPHIQTICHLKSVFPDSENPVAAFQKSFQVSFL